MEDFMTRGEAKATIRKKLGETTAVFFEEDNLNQWITDAQIDIVWITACKRRRTLCSTLTDTLRYTWTSLVPDGLKALSVRIYSNELLKWRRLTQKDYDFLDDRYPQWQSYDAATPLYYIYDREINEFILFPKAQTDYVGTNYLEIYNSFLPATLTADGQQIDLPVQLHPAVTEYAVATGLEARGYQDIADDHWTKYKEKVAGYMTLRELEEDEEICMRGGR
jgi:hypothetical protein